MFYGRKIAIKFQKCFCVKLFQKFVTDYHLKQSGSVWLQTYEKESWIQKKIVISQKGII